jgi:DNA invertase Pin-like site-specific DNA recombinase
MGRAAAPRPSSTMLGAFAEFERPKIMERTTRARLHRLRMG